MSLRLPWSTVREVQGEYPVKQASYSRLPVVHMCVCVCVCVCVCAPRYFYGDWWPEREVFEVNITIRVSFTGDWDFVVCFPVRFCLAVECHHMPTVTVWSKARSRFTLKCGIRGSREDAVQWVLPSGVSIRRAANDFRNSNIRANRLELLRKGSLRLHSISVADSGSYVCIRRSTSPTALGESTSTEKCTITKLVVIGENTIAGPTSCVLVCTQLITNR